MTKPLVNLDGEKFQWVDIDKPDCVYTIYAKSEKQAYKKHSGTGHQYKIGQKVKSIKNGQEYYIVGIKGKSIRDYELDNTMLIVHFEKDKPSRFGFAVRPCQVEVVVSW